MKYLILIFFVAAFCRSSFAQSGCLTCCDESFPYTLCDSGKSGCWTSPVDGALAKSYIPGKVCVDPLPNNMVWMPKLTFDNSDESWMPDPGGSDSVELQWTTDVTNVFVEQNEPVDLSPSNSAMHAQWLLDHTRWLDTMNHYYKKIWDYNQAQIDAQNALNHWLSLCPDLVKDTTCCLHVQTMTDGDSAKLAKWRLFQLSGDQAQTDLPKCHDTSCPTNRFITVNCTEYGRFSVTDTNNITPDPRFGLIEVPEMSWFTGGTPPTGIVTDDSGKVHKLYSWYQLMEHEIGHFLGLRHPDNPVGFGNDTICPNNMTIAGCTGRIMLMQQGRNIANGTPKGLQKDDSCMFKKLYCYSSLGCASSVKDIAPANSFTPRVYPNPSTGITFISYNVSSRSRVQILLLDLLGKSIIGVVNTDQSEGDYTISLPTQYLAAGHYICRVVCGKNEADLNIVILK